MPDKNFCWEVAKGIVDEIQAQEYYKELIDLTENEEIKNILRNNLQQENNHMKSLFEIFKNCSL